MFTRTIKPDHLPTKAPRSESAEQIELVAWIRFNYPNLVFFSVPNETKASIQFQAKLNNMGRMSGVHDLIFLTEPLCSIEMKALSKSARASKEQIEFAKHVTGNSYLCYGAEAGKEAVKEIVALIKKNG